MGIVAEVSLSIETNEQNRRANDLAAEVPVEELAEIVSYANDPANGIVAKTATKIDDAIGARAGIVFPQLLSDLSELSLTRDQASQ